MGVVNLSGGATTNQTMESELSHWLSEFSSTYVESDVLLTKIRHTVNSLDTSSSTNLCVVLEGGLDDLKRGDEEGCLKWSGVAEEWAWEQLHTGDWKDTSVACRELYSLVSLLRGLAYAKMGQHEKALEVVDKGILMGAPVLGHALQEMATVLSGQISQSKKEKENHSTDAASNTQAEQRAASNNDEDLATMTSTESDFPPAQKSREEKPVLKKRVRFRSFVQYDSDTTEPPCKRLKEASPSPERSVEVPNIDPDHRIKVLTNPSISAFQDVMDSNTPVILCQCMEHWPAMGTRRWRYAFFKVEEGVLNWSFAGMAKTIWLEECAIPLNDRMTKVFLDYVCDTHNTLLRILISPVCGL